MVRSTSMVLKSAEMVRARTKLQDQTREHMRAEGDKRAGEREAQALPGDTMARHMMAVEGQEEVAT